MAPKDLAIVILAAGKGTRLKSSLAKVLHRAGGRALVEQVLRACAPLGAKKTVVVVGHQAEQVMAVVEPSGATTVLQRLWARRTQIRNPGRRHRRRIAAHR
jgi:bifunctional N-acetylglucosamine-1-phosphate-uridyltransferase/glucosamine-1-phosphate-acetyltransferase GlmU-like protein